MFKAEIYDKIISFLSNNNNFFLQSQIFYHLKINKNDAVIFNKVFNEIKNDEFVEHSNNRIRIKKEYKIGYIQYLNNGTPYVYIKNDKYTINLNNQTNILHGDKVFVKIEDKYLLIASFVKLLKHKPSQIKGTIMNNNNFAFVIPDDTKKYPYDLFISKKDLKENIQQYDRVLCTVNEYDIKGKPRAIINHTINSLMDEINNLDMIIEKYNIQKDFSNDVISKAGKLKKNVSYNNYLRRVDLSNEYIFTIDGEGAKDLDDAISIKKYGDNYELGVYIADVTNFVEEGSVLDKCAFERGTSYYFINKVIPMLPVELSNDLCSLNPDEKKLCIGIKMMINKDGRVIDRDFFECIIKSKRKCTYEEINAYFDNPKSNFSKESPELLEAIKVGTELSSILYKKRLQRGALIFDYDEMEFKLDENDNVLDLKPRIRGKSNKMIEEFMIVANETVAQLFEELGYPFVYRVHDNPFEEKLEGFLEICKSFNLDVSNINIEEIDQKVLGKLLYEIKDRNLRQSLGMNLITTMKQAKYSENNIGHFGLGSENYCHFTSPIRRYPDLFIHRILKRYIRRILNNDNLKGYLTELSKKVSTHCCYTERNANKAEEEYDILKAFEYLNNRDNEKYKALIYSVSEKGLYILINNCITGFIRLKDCIYNTEDFTIEYNNRIYKIGNVINTVFLEMDAKNNRLIFGLIDGDDKNA